MIYAVQPPVVVRMVSGSQASRVVVSHPGFKPTVFQRRGCGENLT